MWLKAQASAILKFEIRTYLPSIISSTKSATLAESIMAAK
jgi:hypothetical protein